MALSFKDQEIGRLARALAEESLTDAVRHSLAERLERERPRWTELPDLAALLQALGKESAALPDIDDRAPDDIIGYDGAGLWA